KQPAKFWIHTNMLTLNGKKMSKSTGNNILPNEIFSGKNDIFSKAYSPNVIRFFFLQAHYRNELDISESSLEASEKGFLRLIEIIDRLQNIKPIQKSNKELMSFIKSWEKRCLECLNDDFNTPMLIAEIFNSSKIINEIENKNEIGQSEKEYFLNLFDTFLNKILGLSYEKSNSKNDLILDVLLKIRNQARVDKDYKISDKIRDELNKIGVKLNDND
ncbi:MAG: cysteine--tRNA ligase, partial [Flavobacteriales bacterium]|nr:cysteine--tRNA ligase [Flavobacteriales bacterium]